MSSKKIVSERAVLDRATPLLSQLYGNYTVDESQKDRPDAAIYLSKPPQRFGTPSKSVRIGVEITTVDSQIFLAYWNDKKHGRDLVNAQIEDALERGIDGTAPIKKMEVPTTKSMIFDGVKGKGGLYSEYMKQGNFHEMVLLCFSEVIRTDQWYFKDGVLHWTDYLLSEARFPFNKVIFVHRYDGNAVQIYDKRSPRRKPPRPYAYSNVFVTNSQGPMFLTDRAYKLDDIFSQDPLIPPRPPAG